MMGERRVDQGSLFYEFSLERHVPADHLLRAIDRFVDLTDLRVRLAPFYSSVSRPSIDPELLIRQKPPSDRHEPAAPAVGPRKRCHQRNPALFSPSSIWFCASSVPN